jgi:hypothetical protein
MHVRLNDERQPLRGTARRCLQTGGVWLISVTKTVETEPVDSGVTGADQTGKRKRYSSAHDGQQKVIVTAAYIHKRDTDMRFCSL